MAPPPALSPRCGTGNVKGTGRGIQGTAIELSGVASWGLLPLPARNEWGEGWGEGNPNKNGPPLPDPLLPLWGGEGEFLAASPVLFLNSTAVGIQGEGPCFFHTLRKSLHRVRSSAEIGLSFARWGIK